jgi:hypothetical protein
VHDSISFTGRARQVVRVHACCTVPEANLV